MKHSRSQHSWITAQNKTKRQKFAALRTQSQPHSLTHSQQKDEQIERYFADMFHRNKVDLFIDPIATDAIKLRSSIWCPSFILLYMTEWALYHHLIWLSNIFARLKVAQFLGITYILILPHARSKFRSDRSKRNFLIAVMRTLSSYFPLISHFLQGKNKLLMKQFANFSFCKNLYKFSNFYTHALSIFCHAIQTQHLNKKL